MAFLFQNICALQPSFLEIFFLEKIVSTFFSEKELALVVVYISWRKEVGSSLFLLFLFLLLLPSVVSQGCLTLKTHLVRAETEGRNKKREKGEQEQEHHP